MYCENIFLRRKIQAFFPILQALESFSTLIIKFRDEEKAYWLRGLIRVTYRASLQIWFFLLICLHNTETITMITTAINSLCLLWMQAPPSFDVLGQHDDRTRTTSLKIADLVVNGTLMEIKLPVYGKVYILLTELSCNICALEQTFYDY